MGFNKSLRKSNPNCSEKCVIIKSKFSSGNEGLMVWGPHSSMKVLASHPDTSILHSSQKFKKATFQNSFKALIAREQQEINKSLRHVANVMLIFISFLTFAFNLFIFQAADLHFWCQHNETYSVKKKWEGSFIFIPFLKCKKMLKGVLVSKSKVWLRRNC